MVRYCDYVGKDPVATLRAIPVKVLDNFFYWILHKRRESIVSADLSATDDWLRDKLRTLGDVVGFDLPVGPYCFRRGAGDAFDSSGMTRAVADCVCH